MLQIPTKPEMTSPIRVRFQPQMLAELTVIVSYSPGDLSDHIRFAVGRYIETEKATLTARAGQGDVEAQRRLAELRAAYEESTQ